MCSVFYWTRPILSCVTTFLSVCSDWPWNTLEKNIVRAQRVICTVCKSCLSAEHFCAVGTMLIMQQRIRITTKSNFAVRRCRLAISSEFLTIVDCPTQPLSHRASSLHLPAETDGEFIFRLRADRLTINRSPSGLRHILCGTFWISSLTAKWDERTKRRRREWQKSTMKIFIHHKW